MNYKNKDMTPYDMKRPAVKQNPLLLPIIWGASYMMTRTFGLKIEKVNMEQVKPPYLVLATHQGFTDYYIGPLSMFPRRAMYVSDMEGFAAFGNTLYRNIGCIGKRRYVSDANVMVQIKRALKNGQSVFIYPESRHSNIGITAKIPHNMGKLAKHLGVPLVILSCHGSYLANPFWNEEKTRKVPVQAKMELIYTASDLQKLDADTVQRRIEQELTYDEYGYQHEQGFLIRDSDRAEGLEKALYQCRSCGEKYHMRTEGTKLICQKCNHSWELSEDGWLVSQPAAKEEKSKKIHLPDWYRWEETEVIRMLEKQEVTNVEVSHMADTSDPGEDATSKRLKEFSVHIEALPNEKGFVNLGMGTLTLDAQEFLLSIGEERIHFPHAKRESVQTEYNYRKKGKCIVLSTKDCCYYLYSKDIDFEPTELQFIGEYYYDKYYYDKYC